MAKIKKKLEYFYLTTSKSFCSDQWKKALKIIKTEYKLKCLGRYDTGSDYYHGVFGTFTQGKISLIEKTLKEKKLRVSIIREDSR